MLGGLLLDNDAWDRVGDILQDSDFYRYEHKLIYAAIGVLVFAVIAMLLGNTLPGWTSTVVVVAAVGAVQLLALGILGEYVGRMYAMLQGRPTYFVAHDSLDDREPHAHI